MPGVGESLGDHLSVPVAYHCTQPIPVAAAQNEEQLVKNQLVRPPDAPRLVPGAADTLGTCPHPAGPVQVAVTQSGLSQTGTILALPCISSTVNPLRRGPGYPATRQPA
jgi:hypothetical protein